MVFCADNMGLIPSLLYVFLFQVFDNTVSKYENIYEMFEPTIDVTLGRYKSDEVYYWRRLMDCCEKTDPIKNYCITGRDFVRVVFSK